jgi:hypothetical protein
MFECDAITRFLRAALQGLEAESLAGPAAARLVDAFSEVERLAAAGKALAAARASDTNQWRQSAARSPEDWLARRTGTSVAVAKRTLEVAQRLRSAPATSAAVRDGRLSIEQAGVVADATAANPAHEGELLAFASTATLRELRTEAERVKAAACADDAARHEAIRRKRSLRQWVDDAGVWHLHANGTKETGAAFMARLQPMVDAQFRQARQEGRHELPEAYAYDGLMALAESGGSSRPVRKVIVRADLAALRRGSLADGEVCEIAGFGPVPVRAGQDMLGSSALAGAHRRCRRRERHALRPEANRAPADSARVVATDLRPGRMHLDDPSRARPPGRVVGHPTHPARRARPALPVPPRREDPGLPRRAITLIAVPTLGAWSSVRSAWRAHRRTRPSASRWCCSSGGWPRACRSSGR